MTTDPSIPTGTHAGGEALPDELLLDLVEGTLRSGDVERVRAALKADPRLARRLEAMRTDRRTMTSLADAGVSPAPAGLVADAVASAERSNLLDAPSDRRASGGIRRWTPALIAACVGIVAVAGWYANSQGLLFAPADDDSNDMAGSGTVRTDGDPGTGPRMGPHVIPKIADGGPQARDRTGQAMSAIEEREKLAATTTGHLAGSFGIANDPLENETAVGAPFGPDALSGTGIDPDFDSTAVAQRDAEDIWNSAPARPTIPEVVIPDDAATWARAGRLRLVVSPIQEGEADSLERLAARRLFLAMDPGMSRGWGMTSLPVFGPTSLANAAGPGWSGPKTDPHSDEVESKASERPMIATIRLPRDATDEEITLALREMAGGLRALSGMRITLEQAGGPQETPAEPGSDAMTVENLLWWSKPASLWSPSTVYHVPVRASAYIDE